jgi:phosphoribosylaminoimidazolecarboxamide formyltransferase/IMP cyclohydrolase
MPDLVPIRRALLSVSDKSDLIPFARALVSRGVEIISTGGTAKALSDAGIAVTPIDKVTGFPEMMDGRVKTLHPMVHGGLLALRDNPEHERAMREHGIRPIDLVCISLYPFEQTIAKPGIHQHEAIEQIDIGGPSMIRSGAKNSEWVTVITASAQYDRVIGEMSRHDGATGRQLRGELAAAAFGRTSEYDATIASYLSRTSGVAFPHLLRLGYVKSDELRYGENPHQEAAVYRDPASTGPTIVSAAQLHGKQLSYNNINDGAAALELALSLKKLDPKRTGACVIKHTNPCGAALSAGTGEDACREAVDLAIAGDPLAAYGGILAVNRKLDRGAAERVCREDVFLEVIVAPDFAPDALEMLRARWTGVRLLAVGDRAPSATRKIDYRSVPGGMLVQERDTAAPAPDKWVHAAGPAAKSEQLAIAAFLEVVVRFVGSNAIVIGGREGSGAVRLYGIGSGQVDRVSACRLAVEKAGAKAGGAVALGDAFFPFPDGPKVLVDAGVSMIVHPGGSKRDGETFELCKAHGVTCMTTGMRHFKH